MQNRLVIKTDASHNRKVGVGMGYIGFLNGKEYRGRGFLDEDCTSTKAEMISTAWSIHNLTEKIDIIPQNHIIVVKTDCQSTVNKFDDGYDCQEIKFIEYYKKVYDKMLMFWIPRESNRVADSIAKTMLERAKDD